MDILWPDEDSAHTRRALFLPTLQLPPDIQALTGQVRQIDRALIERYLGLMLDRESQSLDLQEIWITQ